MEEKSPNSKSRDFTSWLKNKKTEGFAGEFSVVSTNSTGLFFIDAHENKLPFQDQSQKYPICQDELKNSIGADFYTMIAPELTIKAGYITEYKCRIYKTAKIKGTD